ncbi:MAG: glycosyltransferase family A protein [Maribacter sp.]
MQYYIIIPAHNEEAFLAETLQSVIQQTIQPKKVVIVNDNSTDRTENIIDRFVKESIIFHKLTIRSSDEHMPGSKVVNAFTKGLDLLDDDYDFIVKLDADLILPHDYFERIAEAFRINSQVGIAGGFIYEENQKGEWKLNHPMNKKHVRGAFKAYSKRCFKAIGGLKNAMGWDTLDELLAQYHGFEISTFDVLRVKHLRPTGNAYNPKAKLLQGKAMYTMDYGFWLTVIASLKMAVKQRNLIAFYHNIKGYNNARSEKATIMVTKDQGKFIRRLRWMGIKEKLFV